MALIYSILIKSEYTSINDKIEAIYANIQNATFSREIRIIFVLACIAIA